MSEDQQLSQVKVVLVQPDLIWEAPEQNLQMLESMMKPYYGKADVFILPELFTTGFTMKSSRFALDYSDPLFSRLRLMASEAGATLAGSIIIREKGEYYNRFVWIDQDGSVKSYDKRHLFRMGGEDANYRSGDRQRIVFSTSGFRFLPQICYDLRFPVFSRYRGDYDAVIYIASWPENRQHVWETLLKARAIENQCYVVGVNRTGMDGEGISYRGGSCVISPTGHLIAWLDNQPGTLIASLSLSSLAEFRDKFPVWKDADDFTVS